MALEKPKNEVLCVDCGWEASEWTQQDVDDGETPRCVECEANRIPEGEL